MLKPSYSIYRWLLCATALGVARASCAAEAAPSLLPDLLAEAESRNPSILAAAARIRAAGYAAGQVEALPDPTASVSYTNESLDEFTLGSTPDAELTLGWTQELPRRAKRRLAGEVARAEVDVRGHTLEAVRLRVRAEVEMRYGDLYRLDRTRTILEESRNLLVSFEEASRARYESGPGTLESILRAQTEITRLDVRLASLDQERRSAAATLGALLGRTAERPLGPARDLPPLSVLDPLALEQAALDRAPEILGLQSSVSREDLRVDLARQGLRPDFIWGASYANRGGLDPLVMGLFGVRLPLYRARKQQQALSQALEERESVGLDLAARRADVLAEVRDLVARAERAQTQANLYREGVLPQEQSALDATAAAYANGQVDFLAVLDVFRSLLQDQIEYETQQAEALKVAALLEARTGEGLVGAHGDARAEVDHE